MILSEQTIAVLKNFALINPAMKLPWQGSVTVLSPLKQMMATAKVVEKYRSPWIIYDVNQLLAAIAVIDGKEGKGSADNSNDCVILSDGHQEIKLKFGIESVLTLPPKERLTLPKVYAKFTLTQGQLAAISKAASILKNTHLQVEVVKKTIKISTVNNLDKESHTYSLNPVTDSEALDVKLLFNLQFFNLLPLTYQVSLSDKVMELAHEDVTYWIVSD